MFDGKIELILHEKARRKERNTQSVDKNNDTCLARRKKETYEGNTNKMNKRKINMERKKEKKTDRKLREVSNRKRRH